MNKLFSSDQIKNILINLNNKKSKIGFTNGCFDLFHPGHLYLLQKCKSLCDYLIVGLNSDISISSLKGNSRPVDNQNTRIKNLTINNEVDAVVVFSKDTPLNLIYKLKPNILFKGMDYSDKEVIGSTLEKKNGGEVILIDLLEGYSTSSIIKSYQK